MKDQNKLSAVIQRDGKSQRNNKIDNDWPFRIRFSQNVSEILMGTPDSDNSNEGDGDKLTTMSVLFGEWLLYSTHTLNSY